MKRCDFCAGKVSLVVPNHRSLKERSRITQIGARHREKIWSPAPRSRSVRSSSNTQTSYEMSLSDVDLDRARAGLCPCGERRAPVRAELRPESRRILGMLSVLSGWDVQGPARPGMDEARRLVMATAICARQKA